MGQVPLRDTPAIEDKFVLHNRSHVTFLATAIFLNYVNSEFDQDEQLKHKQIIRQLTRSVVAL